MLCQSWAVPTVLFKSQAECISKQLWRINLTSEKTKLHQVVMLINYRGNSQRHPLEKNLFYLRCSSWSGFLSPWVQFLFSGSSSEPWFSLVQTWRLSRMNKNKNQCDLPSPSGFPTVCAAGLLWQFCLAVSHRVILSSLCRRNNEDEEQVNGWRGRLRLMGLDSIKILKKREAKRLKNKNMDRMEARIQKRGWHKLDLAIFHLMTLFAYHFFLPFYSLQNVACLYVQMLPMWIFSFIFFTHSDSFSLKSFQHLHRNHLSLLPSLYPHPNTGSWGLIYCSACVLIDICSKTVPQIICFRLSWKLILPILC